MPRFIDLLLVGKCDRRGAVCALPPAEALAATPVVVVDNVAEFAWAALGEGKRWELGDIPNAAPLFERVWFEYRAPGAFRNNGVRFLAVHLESKAAEAGGWTVEAEVFELNRSGTPAPLDGGRMYVQPDGRIDPGSDKVPPGLRGHNATAYLCKRCFRLVMGWAPELVQDVAGVDWDDHAIRVDTMPRLVCAGDKVVYLAYVREAP